MAMDIIQMMKRGSGARAKPVASYKEKSENDLTADVYLDSDSDTDVKDTTDEPIWLDGRGRMKMMIRFWTLMILMVLMRS